MKTKYYESVHIEYTKCGELWLLVVSEGIFRDKDKKVIASFYLPRYPNQKHHEVSPEAVRYRLKRDFNIEFGHNSATYK